MTYSKEIKIIRQECLLSQKAFERGLRESLSAVNHRESGKTKPNMSIIKH